MRRALAAPINFLNAASHFSSSSGFPRKAALALGPLSARVARAAQGVWWGAWGGREEGWPVRDRRARHLRGAGAGQIPCRDGPGRRPEPKGQTFVRAALMGRVGWLGGRGRSG